MPISEICNREVVIAHPDDTALEAARLMRQHHVGDLVVVEDRGDAANSGRHRHRPRSRRGNHGARARSGGTDRG